MKLISWCTLLCLASFSWATLQAQQWHEDVFPQLTGDELKQKVRTAFTPDTLLDYNLYARDTLYLNIDAVDRNLSCIYTGLTLPIPEGEDPTQAVYLGGINDGINAEHVFPQAFFNDASQAKSDMHNIFPSRVKTNTDRANFPFGENQDSQTDIWYRNNIEMNTVPTVSIDEYSELLRNNSENFFEPREKSKGDIARAMFYIYTIYQDLSGADSYFALQRPTLCNWHFMDEVDEKEWKRSKGIKRYQGNENPFVLDCTLAQRLYCQEFSNTCLEVATEENDFGKDDFIYNVFNNELIITSSMVGTLTIYAINGEKIFELNYPKINEVISLQNLGAGHYFVRANQKTKKIQVIK